GNLTYAFKDGSSVWWSGIMIRNYPVPITSVEIKTPSTNWKNLPRMDYNYWLDESGFGEGPYSLRITDVLGDVVEAHDIPSLTSGQVPSIVEKPLDVQLPGCSGSSVTPTPSPAGILGDANNDDSVDIVDALLAAQSYVGLNPAGFDLRNADVNCDGIVDIIDALPIAQDYVGLVSGFC
ncbi:MAG: hypothetical protein JXJ04_09865, partial [Spirochaetales bacterium]|nr:hypothetical protein [Spirochaetales bacterium]